MVPAPMSAPSEEPAPEAQPHPPESRTRMWVCLTGLVSFFVCLVFVLDGSELSAADQALVAMGFLATPIVLFDVFVLRVYRRESTGLVWGQARPFVWPRVAVKLVGLSATFAVLAFVYWAFSEYERSLYEPFF